jgi:nucleoside-diphosphate-sugar epimerase
MGDLGYLDEKGRLWFCGRKAHRVVTPRRTYFTVPCEAIFNTHPQVHRTALVGVRRDGEIRLVLCVELERNGTGDEALTAELLALGATAAVLRAVEGMDVVFHVAARVGVWGPGNAYQRTNVLGTQHVLAACRAHEVPRLVYTSTPSVVHGGIDIEGGDESLPYAETFSSHYPRTKAIAERMVLAADGERLSTLALRPHLVWGPGDNQLVPRIVARGRAGRLRLIGDRPNVIDTVYVDNAADAHLAAADRLTPGAACAGKAYVVSNGEPLPLAEITNGILAAAGLLPVTKRIPVPLAIALGGLAELVYAGLRIRSEPPLTRFLARQLSSAHWFDIWAARRDLGYEPRVSIAEGLERLAASFAGGAADAATQPI